MKTRRSIRALLATLLVAMGMQLVMALPASAAALTSVSWNLSRPHPGDTAVRYTWTFTTATTGTIATVTFGVPAGTAGAALTVTDNYGIGVGTAALAGTTVTYTVTTPASIASGIKILIAIDGFTNTSTTGSYASAVTTNTSVPAVIDGPTNSPNVAINSNTTAVTVVIARSTTFTDSLNSFQFLMEPTLAATNDQTQPETLTIKSNAANGYSLNIKASALTDGLGHNISSVTAGIATGVATASFTADRWGYQGTVTGVGTRQGAGFNVNGNYVGFTAAGENAVSSAGPTNTDTIALTHRVKIDFGQGAGTYTSTITYTVSETY